MTGHATSLAPCSRASRAQGLIPRPRDRAAARANASCADGENLALVIAQYLEIRTANPDHVLFCHVDDFYVLFFEDAKIASRTVGMPLIKRAKLMGTLLPMCAAPLEMADDYAQRLVGAEYGVAICEPIEDPAKARERGGTFVVRRDVVRLITPALVVRRRRR